MDRSRFSSLSRTDAAVAIQSYPQRFGALVRQVERTKASAADELTDIVNRSGPSGRSALGILATVSARFSSIDEALRQVAIIDDPPIAADVFGDSHPPSSAASIEAALSLVENAASSLAVRIEGIANGDLQRSGVMQSGTTLTLLDLIHEAVAVGRNNLDEFSSTLEAVST